MKVNKNNLKRTITQLTKKNDSSLDILITELQEILDGRRIYTIHKTTKDICRFCGYSITALATGWKITEE